MEPEEEDNAELTLSEKQKLISSFTAAAQTHEDTST